MKKAKEFAYNLPIFFLWLILVRDDEDAAEPSDTASFFGGLPLFALPFSATGFLTMVSSKNAGVE